MDVKYNEPILRVLYYRSLNDDLFDVVEDALNKANYCVKIIGGGEYINHRGKINGHCDFALLRYRNFDRDFCEDIIESILNFRIETVLIIDDPILNPSYQ